MIHLRKVTAKVGLIVSLIFLLSFAQDAKAQDGKALFTANCASCHSVHKDMTGPALAGVESRWPDRAHIIAWVHNSSKVLSSGDKYANTLFEKWNKTPMTHFEGLLSDDDVNAILDYVKVEEAKKTAAPAAGAATQTSGEQSDNTLLYVVLTGVLAIVAIILLQVNSSLKRMSNKKEGHPVLGPIPFYRNKKFIAVVAILIFIYIGYWLASGAIGLGHSQNYEPKQPIFYSHKVHAGINQINCLYCHTNAQYSRHATIPSVNVCMNCHMAITEYTGPKLFTAEGEEVDGSAEIQKLYKYAGYVQGQPWDASKAKPIEWVRIHELPDHVYFNHSQHVMVGKVQCQTCHGDITKMDEVKQFAPLTMGWCINCHRTTNVQFKDNGFYSIYQKYHEGLKNGTIDSAKGITVEMIGGTECQKCHY
ncbi:c-type cytochrome [Arachidicoccus terrestris]|uniref:c-type cytochrome n=1 Tax=Arachidicoccus terrestris TaxID=2875539 RepID=UPI001CC74892|nr:c-type cytochrome [Arachidicoccus terrestris]UAY53890.1 c-type cytochrome [Arachidicoccus terrestris]